MLLLLSLINKRTHKDRKIMNVAVFFSCPVHHQCLQQTWSDIKLWQKRDLVKKRVPLRNKYAVAKTSLKYKYTVYILQKILS